MAAGGTALPHTPLMPCTLHMGTARLPRCHRHLCHWAQRASMIEHAVGCRPWHSTVRAGCHASTLHAWPRDGPEQHACCTHTHANNATCSLLLPVVL
eukprot:351563-Chlamydomonas_euryale.AAC.9